jgi:ubiquinone/menaquinone biosynthesis C-methylase UbiE
VNVESGTRTAAPADSEIRAFLDLLRCPATGGPLEFRDRALVSAGGAYRYPIDDAGIAQFAASPESSDAQIQQAHYDRVADAYVTNLSYPHTREYTAYLDQALLVQLPAAGLGDLAEICCGRGEAVELVAGRFKRAVGVDISLNMLRAARNHHRAPNLGFIQGDATRLPLADGAFDSVLMLGGIHHVNDRIGLFREVARILKPGGRFYFREPVSDFWLWLMLRKVIYRISPSLDHLTERPLRYDETAPYLTRAQLRLISWKTYGFFGFCLLMNSDVLIFNRLFRFIPGIRAITRAFARFDDWITSRRNWARRGLQVVGVAEKPEGSLT